MYKIIFSLQPNKHSVPTVHAHNHTLALSKFRAEVKTDRWTGLSFSDRHSRASGWKPLWRGCPSFPGAQPPPETVSSGAALQEGVTWALIAANSATFFMTNIVTFQ